MQYCCGYGMLKYLRGCTEGLHLMLDLGAAQLALYVAALQLMAMSMGFHSPREVGKFLEGTCTCRSHVGDGLNETSSLSQESGCLQQIFKTIDTINQLYHIGRVQNAVKHKLKHQEDHFQFYITITFSVASIISKVSVGLYTQNQPKHTL